MRRLISSTGNPSVRRVSYGLALLAIVATSYLAIGIFLWGVGSNPHPTADAPTRDAATIRAACEQHVLHAEHRARTAMARRADEFAAFVQSRKVGARPFAEDMVSIGAKGRVVWAWLPFTDKDGHKRYVEEKFAQHIFSPGQLTVAISQSTENGRRDLDGIENGLAVQLRQELLGRALSPREIPAAIEEFHATVGQLMKVAQWEAARSAGAFAISETVSQVGGQVLVRLSVSTGLLAAGAANAWWSLGAGLVLGFVVDAVWDKINDPSGEIEIKTVQGLDQLSLRARQVIHQQLLQDLTRRSVSWKKSIEGSAG